MKLRGRDTEMLNDDELVRLACDGNKNAEDIIVSRYSRLVESIAAPYFISGGDSDDLVQIGYIGLLKAVRSFNADKETKFKAYASRCIKNAVLDGLREANAKKNVPLNTALISASDENGEESALIDSLPSPEPTPEEQIIGKENEEAFYEVLYDALGETDATVLKLYLASAPYKEISEQLGITAKKVDNTIYSAKKKIEKLLKNSKLTK